MSASFDRGLSWVPSLLRVQNLIDPDQKTVIVIMLEASEDVILPIVALEREGKKALFEDEFALFVAEQSQDLLFSGFQVASD